MAIIASACCSRPDAKFRVLSNEVPTVQPGKQILKGPTARDRRATALILLEILCVGYVIIKLMGQDVRGGREGTQHRRAERASS
jgi:hypothetical protein